MNFETMYFEKEGRIGYLTLNRPQLLNAMNYQGALDLNRAAEMIRDEPDVAACTYQGFRPCVLHGHRLETTHSRRDPSPLLRELGQGAQNPRTV